MAYMISASGEAFYTNNAEWHKDAKEVTKKEYEAARKINSVKTLKKMLKPKSKVYTILRSVSNSGMSRRISLVVKTKEGVDDITHLAAIAMDRKLSDKGGIVIGGCGMDMGFSLVYSLGMALWPKGTAKPHGMRNGEPDSNGGYALKHEWL